MEKASDNVLFELGQLRYALFESQDPAKGDFDVIFQFKNEDKELHAHSFMLWSVSDELKTMIKGVWANKDNRIPITAHSYNDFKTFLTFLYLGQCEINTENVMALVDLSESYNIPLLKNKCDVFLTNAVSPENVLDIYEGSKFYNLKNALKTAMDCIAKNAEKVLASKEVLKLKKETILDIVMKPQLAITEEALYSAVFKWAQNQLNESSEDYQTKMKDLLADILPHIGFSVMKIDFIHNFVVPNGFVFPNSYEEIGRILRDATSISRNPSAVQATNNHLRQFRIKCIIMTDRKGRKATGYIRSSQIYACLFKYVGQWSTKLINNFAKWDIDLPETEPSIDASSLKNEDWILVRTADGKFGAGKYEHILGSKESVVYLAKLDPEQTFDLFNHCEFFYTLD